MLGPGCISRITGCEFPSFVVLVTMKNFIFICYHLIKIDLPRENGTSTMAGTIFVLLVIVFPVPRKVLAHSRDQEYISSVNESKKGRWSFRL